MAEDDVLRTMSESADSAPPGAVEPTAQAEPEPAAYEWKGADGASYRVLPSGEVIAHDGAKAPLHNLFQTHRQFGHLQQRWTQEAKPWLDFASRYALTPDLIPALERALARMAEARRAASPATSEPEFPKELLELYPELGQLFGTMRQQLQASRQQLEQGGTRLAEVERYQKQQKSVHLAQQTLGDVQRWVQALAEQVPDLKDPQQQAKVFQVLYEENWPLTQITEANVRRVALDLFAHRLGKRAQGKETFSEGAGGRLPTPKTTDTEQLIRELIDAG